MGFLDSEGPKALDINVYAFVIKEVVDGVQASAASVGRKDKNELVLTGRGLPYRPLSLSGTQRLTQTWLPGYANATSQPLGAKEETTTIHGKWSDKFIRTETAPKTQLGPLGDTFSAVDTAVNNFGAPFSGAKSKGKEPPPSTTVPIKWRNVAVDSVFEAVEIVDAMRRTAMHIEVNWGRHARRGYITTFTHHWLNEHDVEWEIEFTWSSRGVVTEPVVADKLFSNTSTASLLQVLSDKLHLEALPPTFPMSKNLLTSVTQGIARIAATTQAVSDTITNVTSLALAPVTVARSVVGLCSTLRGQCEELKNRLLAQGHGAAVLGADPVARTGTSTDLNVGVVTQASGQAGGAALTRSETYASPSEVNQAAEYMGRVQSAIRELRSAALLLQDDYRKQLERDVQAVIYVREGDDLRLISTRFYGTPDNWRKLAQANGLTAARLTAGMRIVIPAASFDEAC